jgi:hypothetical protein
MQSAALPLGPDLVAALLRHLHAGYRLIGYGWCYERADGALVPELVDSLRSYEYTKFGQYWRLQTLLCNIHATTEEVRARVREQITELQDRFGLRTDRRHVVDQILGTLRGSPPVA